MFFFIICVYTLKVGNDIYRDFKIEMFFSINKIVLGQKA